MSDLSLLKLGGRAGWTPRGAPLLGDCFLTPSITGHGRQGPDNSTKWYGALYQMMQYIDNIL